MIFDILIHFLLNIYIVYNICNYIPRLIMLNANYKLTSKGRINNKIHHNSYLYNASNRDIVKPSPDLLYSYVFIDFNKINYIIFELPECHVYRSLTLYDNDTNVIHVYNHNKLSENISINSIMIVSPNYKIQNNDPNIIIVKSPTNICLGIQRILCSNKNKLNTLIDIQQKFIIKEINYKKQLSLLENINFYLILNIISVIIIISLLLYFHLLNSIYILTCIFIDCFIYYMNQELANILLSYFDKIPNSPWKFNTLIGCKDCNCFLRLYIAITSILALTKEEAIYMIANTDSSGNKLMSNEHYIIYFSSILPTTWWSITAYGYDNYLIPNTNNIYSYNNEDVIKNSLVIHLSSVNNSYKNWLPSGATNPQLVLRLYNPDLSKTIDAQHLPKILHIKTRLNY
jgi:hypothetical protein